MSQTNSPVDSSLPSAFAKPPAAAAMFQSQYAASDAGQLAAQGAASQPQPNLSAPMPQPESLTIPGPRQGNPILPSSPNATATQPQVAPPPSAETARPGVKPAPVPPPDAHLSSDAYAQRQFDAERRAWEAEREQWRAVAQDQAKMLQDAMGVQKEYEQLKRQADLAKQLSDDELFADMTTLDADDARRVIQYAAQTLQGPIDAMRQELEKQQAELQKQRQMMDQQMYQVYQQRATEKLYAAHPDFPQLIQDPKFVQYAQQRDGFSSRTREQMAWEEFTRGNPDYVINMVNEFKGIPSGADNMRVAPPAQFASGYATPAQPAETQPRYTLAELNSLMQMRRITPEQYRVYLTELRNAQPPR